jgi:hypothetical protein
LHCPQKILRLHALQAMLVVDTLSHAI